jgi:hypothetical protein
MFPFVCPGQWSKVCGQCCAFYCVKTKELIPQACLINNHSIKVGHSMLCFSSTTRTKSTINVSVCLFWTMVRGLRLLLCILICENKRFYPTKAIYTLTTTHNSKVGHSMLCLSSTTRNKSTAYVSFCLCWTMVRGLRSLLCILMCENKSFQPTKAI